MADLICLATTGHNTKRLKWPASKQLQHVVERHALILRAVNGAGKLCARRCRSIRVVTLSIHWKPAREPLESQKTKFGLLAELADAMDSKSIDAPSKHTEKSADSHGGRDSLANRWPDDASDMAKLWPKLTTKQRRQLLGLARSMVE